jgi:hypothetical protein
VDSLFIIFLVALTSVLAYYAMHWNNRTRIRDAFRALFEWAGTFSLFLVTNLVLGASIVLVVRTITPRFVSLYMLQNVLLLILSAAQAFVFHQWWKRGSNPE